VTADDTTDRTDGPDGPDSSESDRDPPAWEMLDSRVAYECEGFEVHNESVRLPDGTETEFDYLSEPPSVVVLAFVDDPADPAAPEDRTVVTIEEWRHAVGRVNYGLPAGGVEPGDDDLRAAAHRELAEETGYAADRVEPLVSFEPTNGLADSRFHYALAYSCTPDADQQLDHDETIRVHTTTLGELRRKITTGEIRDGRTAMGVLFHQVHGGRGPGWD